MGNSRNQLTILCVVLLVGFVAAHVGAIDRVWFVRSVDPGEGQINGGGLSALAMRSNGTWPVAAYFNASDGQTEISMMGPTGWQTYTETSSVAMFLDGSQSDSGRVGFAWANGQVNILDNNGWSTTSFGGQLNNYITERPSLAFNSQDMPCVAYNTYQGDQLAVASYSGYGWYQDTIRNNEYDYFNADAFALDYDSYGQANVAFADGGNLWFAQKGVATSYQWALQELTPDLGYFNDVFMMDVVVDAQDNVWVGFTSQGSMNVAIYDPVTLSWHNSILGLVDSGFGYFTMTADREGGVGLAYINSGGQLAYLHNDGSGLWASELVMNFETGMYVESNPTLGVGLAFDVQNNPVISYKDYESGLSLAYDPVAVPEPATMALFILGATIIRRRRHS